MRHRGELPRIGQLGFPFDGAEREIAGVPYEDEG